MAEIASAGRSGPLTPTSATHVTPNLPSPRAHTSPLVHTAPQSRHPLAMYDAVVPQHRRHYRAGTSLDTRYTGCDARAASVLKDRYTKRNNSRYVLARNAHAPRYILRDIVRPARARPARITRRYTVSLAHCGRLTGACKPLLLALSMRGHCACPAPVLRSSRAMSADCLAQQLRPTRAIVVVYRRECDAILAPMNPPQLPHTRATLPPHARLTGATADRTPLDRGGRS